MLLRFFSFIFHALQWSCCTYSNNVGLFCHILNFNLDSSNLNDFFLNLHTLRLTPCAVKFCGFTQMHSTCIYHYSTIQNSLTIEKVSPVLHSLNTPPKHCPELLATTDHFIDCIVLSFLEHHIIKII